MKKKIALLSAIITLLIFSLLLFSCKNTESDTMLDEEIKTSEEAQDIQEEPANTGEATPDEENGPDEDTKEEDAPQPAPIIDISPAEVFEILKNDEDYILVDVRTQEEYDSGHIEGAILLPVQELEERLDELSKDESIIVYCRSGARSRSAAETLVANGFTMIYDMGGIDDWIAEGYPVILEE